MRLKSFQEIPTTEAVIDRSHGYNHTFHPTEWIEVCVELDSEQARLLPRTDSELKRALSYVNATSCKHVPDGHSPEIMLRFYILHDNQFGTTKDNEIQRIILKRLEHAFHNLKRAS